MEITQELLQTIYKRVNQVYVAKTGHEANTIILSEDNSFYCYCSEYHFGEWSIVDELAITSEDINTADLDALIAEREKKEAERKKEEQKRLEDEMKKREEREKKERYDKFLKLKQEFETTPKSTTNEQ